jgi:hypothetical protein
MFIRKLSPVLVLVLAVLAIGASSASGSTALRTDPGGGLLTGSTTITNTTAAPSVLTLTGLGVVTCNQTNFDLHVNFSFSVFGVSVTGALTFGTFTSCTDTLPVITISSCTLNPGTTPSIHIFAGNDTGGTTTIDDPTFRCNIAGSTTSFCYYTAGTAVGQGNNTASTLTFSSVGVGTVGGSGSLGAACGSSGTFSTTLRHMVQGGTNRTVTVQTT